MNMKLTSFGAADGVTGSKHLVEIGGSRILLDCGLFQGLKLHRERNWQPLPIDLHSIDAVILSHDSHIALHETGGAAANSGVQLVPVGGRCVFTADDVRAAMGEAAANFLADPRAGAGHQNDGFLRGLPSHTISLPLIRLRRAQRRAAL